ncbi:hypothetical protein Q5752_005971 [Cryptotrichosporon argae]
MSLKSFGSLIQCCRMEQYQEIVGNPGYDPYAGYAGYEYDSPDVYADTFYDEQQALNLAHIPDNDFDELNHGSHEININDDRDEYDDVYVPEYVAEPLVIGRPADARPLAADIARAWCDLYPGECRARGLEAPEHTDLAAANATAGPEVPPSRKSLDLNGLLIGAALLLLLLLALQGGGGGGGDNDVKAGKGSSGKVTAAELEREAARKTDAAKDAKDRATQEMVKADAAERAADAARQRADNMPPGPRKDAAEADAQEADAKAEQQRRRAQQAARAAQQAADAADAAQVAAAEQAEAERRAREEKDKADKAARQSKREEAEAKARREGAEQRAMEENVERDGAGRPSNERPTKPSKGGKDPGADWVDGEPRETPEQRAARKAAEAANRLNGDRTTVGETPEERAARKAKEARDKADKEKADKEKADKEKADKEKADKARRDAAERERRKREWERKQRRDDEPPAAGETPEQRAERKAKEARDRAKAQAERAKRDKEAKAAEDAERERRRREHERRRGEADDDETANAETPEQQDIRQALERKNQEPGDGPDGTRETPEERAARKRREWEEAHGHRPEGTRETPEQRAARRRQEREGRVGTPETEEQAARRNGATDLPQPPAYGRPRTTATTTTTTTPGLLSALPRWAIPALIGLGLLFLLGNMIPSQRVYSLYSPRSLFDPPARRVEPVVSVPIALPTSPAPHWEPPPPVIEIPRAAPIVGPASAAPILPVPNLASVVPPHLDLFLPLVMASALSLSPLVIDYLRGYPVPIYRHGIYLPAYFHLVILGATALGLILAANARFRWSSWYLPLLDPIISAISFAAHTAAASTPSVGEAVENTLFGDRSVLGAVVAGCVVIALSRQPPPYPSSVKTTAYQSPLHQLLCALGMGVIGSIFWNA